MNFAEPRICTEVFSQARSARIHETTRQRSRKAIGQLRGNDRGRPRRIGFKRLGDPPAGIEMDRAGVAAEKVEALCEFSTTLDRIRVSNRQVLVYSFFGEPEIVEQEIQKIEAAKPRFDAAVSRVERLMESPS